MKTLDEFQEKKQAILDAYDELLSSDFVADSGTDADKIREKRTQLQDEKFVVAVCGQRNAGKSTLLNALVFRKPVLPSDVTVMTATNTFLRYGEESGFKATFYSSAEWNTFVSSVRNDEKAWLRLNESLDKAANAGAYKDEYVRPVSHTVQSDDLDELTKFAGTVDNGGLYTPFVKSLEIYHDHPWLEDVEIADTPGVNDPNPIREDITKSWIHNADAVVYVTYAGQAMDQFDIKFIDQHLMHVPSRRRLVAVNKTDTLNDLSSVENWLDRLREDTRFSVLLGDKNTNHFISGLGGLIDRMDRDGSEFSSELKEEAELLAMQGYLDAENHRIGEFQNAVGKHLIDTKGERLLEGHVRFLNSLFELRELELRDERTETADILDDISTEKHELQSKIKKIKTTRTKISRLRNDQTTKFKRDCEKHLQEMKNNLNQIKDKIHDKIEGTLKQFQHHKRFSTSGWKIISAIEGEEKATFNKINKTREGLQTSLDNSLEDVREELKTIAKQEDVLSSERTSTLLDVSAYKSTQKLHSQISTKIQKMETDKIIKSCSKAHQRLFNTQTGLTNIRDKLHEEINTSISNSFRMIQKELENQFMEEYRKAPEAAQTAINQALEEKQQKLEELEENRSSVDQRRAELRDKLARTESMLDKTMTLREIIVPQI